MIYWAFVTAVLMFVVPAIVITVLLRRNGRRLGYTGLFQYLRAVPFTDAQRRDAVNLVLQGLVICVFALLIPPLWLVGVFPLFYGTRKVLFALLGLGLVNDANLQDR